MKTLLTILLSIFLITSIQSQSKEGVSGFYLSGHFGPGIDPSFQAAYAEFNLSAGWQWNRFLGLGLSLGNYNGIGLDYSVGFSGAALQYRVRPFKKWTIKLDYGYLLKYNYPSADGYTVYEYIPDRYTYFSCHLLWKPKKSFTLGLGFTGLPKVKFKECDYYYVNSIDDCSDWYERTYKWSPAGFMLTLGLSLN